jgi:hypothetical protein
MRRLCYLNLLVCLLLSATIPVNTAGAQMPQRGANQIAIIGWTDDSHYQIMNFFGKEAGDSSSASGRTRNDIVD